MAYCSFCKRNHNVGFISTRFAGTDGVSLETAKWADVFERVGFACYYFAGELDRRTECSYLVREARFQHPDIDDVFRDHFRNRNAHHHDFFWERQHFMTNSVWEYLNMAFPPHLPTIQHVVINSSADNQLSLRTGISPTVIPNVMDFENPPPMPGGIESCGFDSQNGVGTADDYASDVRQALGVADDVLLILQPTRVVKRNGRICIK